MQAQTLQKITPTTMQSGPLSTVPVLREDSQPQREKNPLSGSSTQLFPSSDKAFSRCVLSSTHTQRFLPEEVNQYRKEEQHS